VVIDSSALIAILLDEPDREALLEAIAAAADPVISAATLLEASVVIYARKGQQGVQDLDELVHSSGARPVAFDSTQGVAARTAYALYGKGSGRANLNLGDTFAYALAKTLRKPLLFKGDDFAKTDVVPALPPS
jgi:ribonuclease VapC